MTRRRSSSGAGCYNTITALSLLGTVAVIVGVAVVLLSPPPAPSDAQLTAVAALVIPTRTPTLSPTPSETPRPTRTPLPPTFTFTPTETETPSPTPTLTETPTPTPTITDTPAPTFTPSLTFTPAATDTPTPTETPTGATPTFTPSVSPFVFGLREPVRFAPNFANAAACAWQGLGGQVIGLDGQPFNGRLQVRVFNNDLDRTAPVGSNSFYGTTGANGLNTGWEVVVGTGISPQLYFVRLETINGTPVSDLIQVQFPNVCEGNLAILNFVQQRPIQ